ncbi:MAG TPA: hypothetical protein VMM83_05875 [Longimicrobiales bacterium]|nr:hypothetical protein [Longimicrobiales bacterium]
MPEKLAMCSRTLLAVTITLLGSVPLHAQDTEVPRTRTLSGIASPAFPYAEPDDVGLSGERLALLGDEVAKWVAVTVIVAGDRIRGLGRTDSLAVPTCATAIDATGNDVADNTFDEVASLAVALQGDSTRVELRSAGEKVRDARK